MKTYKVDSKIDWSGKVEKTVTKHKYNSGSTVLTTTETFTYSPQDKLVLHKHKINTGSEELIAKNNYDELGQLIRKEVGGQNFSGANSFQKVDYKYNIRGWLKEINDVDDLSIDNDLFAFKINYNEGLDPLFNGNISETFWITDNNNVLRKYEHHYDKLNRLTESNFSFPANSDNIGMPFSVTDSYREKLSYDKNGNITSLLRNGEIEDDNYVVEIDNLTYFYNSDNKNLLEQVTDQSNHPKGFKDDGDGLRDYYYDGFGNLKKDNNKDIDSIFYNHMNLPVEIVFVSGDKINYIYNALGQKISKVVNSNSSIIVTDYLSGGFQYVDGNLSFFPHAEGYIKAKNINGVNNYNYVYNYLDHLGNVRLSYSDIDSNGILGDEYVQECITTLGGENSPVIICSDYFTSPIIEENHYYPFGLKHEGYPGETNNPNYKYKYNGKEFQDELGLNMYDYGARNYDPAIGRWMNIDPLAEQGRRWSPYNYAMNNPVYFLDPDGMLSQSFIDDMWNKSGDGETKWVNNDNGSFSSNTGESIETEESNEGNEIDGNGGGDKKKSGDKKKGGDKKNEPKPKEDNCAICPDYDLDGESSWWEWSIDGLLYAGDFLLGGPTGESLVIKGAIMGVTKKGIAKTASTIAKNAKKMLPDEIGTFLGAGKNWHKTSAKSDFLKKFKKELKGDTNADFYIDKSTKEVFLKSNKSGNWINTGQKFQ